MRLKFKKYPACRNRVGRLAKAISFAATTAACSVMAVNAADSKPQQFDMDHITLTRALEIFTEQTNMQIMFASDLSSLDKPISLKGSYTPMQALAKILDGTGLEYVADGNGNVAVRVTQSDAATERDEPSRVKDQSKEQQIEEMVVTASRRGAGTSIQDTAISISALSAETIDKRNLVGMDDYLRTLPGVSMQDRGAGQNTIIMRGIAANPQGEDATVGVYFGEVPVTTLGSTSNGNQKGSLDVKLVDIERVEVLRGPQGTLYGSGSMGGTVRVIPASPNLQAVEGKVAARYSATGEKGGDNTMVQGVFNVPIIEDKLAVRAVAYQFKNSGYIENVAASNPLPSVAAAIALSGVARDRSDVGNDEYTGFRISALWSPIEQLNVTLVHTYQEIEQDGFPEVHLDLPGDFLQARLGVGPGTGDMDEGFGNEVDITNLNIEYDFGWGALSSSTAKIAYDSYSRFDVSFFGIPTGSQFSKTTDVFVQEFRFTSQFDGPIQFLAGLYYEDIDEAGFDENNIHYSGTVPNPALHSDLFYDVKVLNKQKAVFGELTYNLTDQFAVTLGGRYFEYDQSSDLLQEGLFWGLPAVFDVESNNKDNDQTYKVNLSYTPNDDILIYGQWAEGFRLGSAQLLNCDPDGDGRVQFADGIEREVPTSIAPDSLESFELGVKTSLADSRVTVNASIYHINWQGLPVSLATECTTSLKLNAGESTAEGFELEVQALLSDNLQLEIGTSYGESILAADAESLGSKGDNLPGSPDFNFFTALEYRFTVSGYESFARIDYSYVDEFYHNIAELGQASGGYTQVNLKTGISINQVDIDLFANNLTNANDFTWVESAFNVGRAYRLRPRTIGFNVSYKF